MKQSLKYHLPKLKEVITFKEFVKADFEGGKYIAHCEDSKKNKFKKEKLSEKTLILIRPESDFSPKEIELTLQNNYKAVSLGTSRLRTETAGIVTVHTINLKKLEL